MTRTYIRENLKKEFDFQHLIDEEHFSMDFHCHDHIEIYLSISGGEHFIIDDNIYDMEPGDMFVNNQLEIHRTTARRNVKYERYVLSFKDSFLLPYCTAKTDLLHYIYRRPSGFSNKITLSENQFCLFIQLAERYETLANETYANDVMRTLVFVEMLALVAQFYRQPFQTSSEASAHESMDIVSGLLKYISTHFAERISLDDLAVQMKVSKFHLCKIFKSKTGTTINRYITTRRIAEAKYLLSKGMPVTETCYQSGFNDLSHFIRTFHNTVGISPGKYLAENSLKELNCYVGPEAKPGSL